jgi:hypothetical protein
MTISIVGLVPENEGAALGFSNLWRSCQVADTSYCWVHLSCQLSVASLRLQSRACKTLALVACFRAKTAFDRAEIEGKRSVGSSDTHTLPQNPSVRCLSELSAL